MCRARLLTVVVALCSVLATPALADPGVPPEVLGPENGATVQAGQPVTFRVRSHAGDGYLWVLFSASPNPAAACGTIGRDIGLRSLEPTADPTVYEATPPMYELYTHWLNRPGTYYWQAYRIEHGGGADGCTEAPVRALTVVGQRPVEIGPVPEQPADGATFFTGSALTFTATTAIPSDDKLWIHVSTSAAKTQRGGLIDDDAELEQLAPASPAGTFRAAPQRFTHATFWMNTAGTYFWQPYRISSFGDPDGFVQGAVRRFVLIKPPPVFGSGGAVIVPSTRKCVSRRLFRIRVRRVKGVTYTKVEVRLRGKLVKTVKGSRIFANIDLRGLPKGKWTVEIRASTTNGGTLKGRRTYRTCTAKRPGGTTSPL